MKDQTLSIKQMQYLKKLGIDTSNASMALVYKNAYGDFVDWEAADDNLHSSHIGEYNSYLRSKYGVFTFQDIFDLLPKNITSKDNNKVCLEIVFPNNNKWEVFYGLIKSFFDEKLINALYKMLVWCAENDYININKEE